MRKKDFRFGISVDIRSIDLNKVLIENSASTFLMRVSEDMTDLGLLIDDVVLVDRSLKPKIKDIVVVAQTSDPDLKITKFKMLSDELVCWGVVTRVIRSLR